ncbi:MAG TPA: cyclic nucleotide-binding domain-containing protein [Acidimicrobiia bacterium]|nr:cyclic nucleotide-binding domain-containing protein [Acidimicrobiia bacterium]
MWGRGDSRIAEYRALSLFEGCSPSELRRVSSGAARLSVAAGTVLVREGQRQGQFVIVFGGVADVWRGGRQIDQITAGDSFGEIGLIRRVREPATIVARTEMSIDVIAGAEFRTAYADSALVRHRLESKLDQRLASWHRAPGLTLEQRPVISPRPSSFRPSRPRTGTSRSTRPGTTRCPTRR